MRFAASGAEIKRTKDKLASLVRRVYFGVRIVDGQSAAGGARGVDVATHIAIGRLIVGWFLLDTLVTDLGRVQITFRFYELWTLIRNPGLLLSGIGESHAFAKFSFGVLCIAAAFALLTPLFSDSKLARFAGLAPLFFIVVFGGLLYLKASTDYFSTRAPSGSIEAQVVDLANSVTNRILGKAAQRVEIGLGGYVAAVASCYLAWRVLRRATSSHA